MKGYSHTKAGVTDIVLDKLNNPTIAGSFRDSIDFNPSAATYYLYHPSGTPFVSRYTASGEFRWALLFDLVTPSAASIEDLAVGSSGEVVVCGWLKGIVSCVSPAAFSYTASSGERHSFVMKLDSTGQLQWISFFAGSHITAKSVAVDALSNVVIVGSFSSTADFDPGPASYTLNGGSKQSPFVAKLNSQGMLSWAIHMPSSQDSYCSIVSIGSDHHVYAAGMIGAAGTDLDPGPAGFYTTQSCGYVARYSPTGQFVGAAMFNGTVCVVQSVLVLDTSTYLMAGEFDLSCDLDPGPGTFYSSGAGTKSFIAKIKGADSLVWVNQFETNWKATLPGKTILRDSSGYFYFACRLQNDTCDFDPGPGTHILAMQMPCCGWTTLVLCRYDGDGNLVWGFSQGPVLNASVASDTLGTVVISGNFVGPQDFDPTPAVVNYSSNASGTLFLQKLSLCTPPPPPVINTDTTGSSGCGPSSFTLYATGDTVSWYLVPTGGSALFTGNPFVVPNLSTTTTFYAENRSCTKSISRSAQTLSIRPAPVVSIVAQKTLSCPGDGQILTAQGALLYSWSNGLPATPTVSVVVTQNTTYSVSGTNAEGCSDTASIFILMNDCAGLTEWFIKQPISPNPFNDYLVTHLSPGTRLRMYDSEGKVVYEAVIQSGGELIDTSKLSTGIYLVRCKTEDKIISARLVK